MSLRMPKNKSLHKRKRVRKTVKNKYLHDETEERKQVVIQLEEKYLKQKFNKYAFISNEKPIKKRKIKKIEVKDEDVFNTQDRLIKEIEKQREENNNIIKEYLIEF